MKATIITLALIASIVAAGWYLSQPRYKNAKETAKVLELKKFYEQAAKEQPAQ